MTAFSFRSFSCVATIASGSNHLPLSLHTHKTLYTLLKYLLPDLKIRPILYIGGQIECYNGQIAPQPSAKQAKKSTER